MVVVVCCAFDSLSAGFVLYSVVTNDFAVDVSILVIGLIPGSDVFILIVLVSAVTEIDVPSAGITVISLAMFV